MIQHSSSLDLLVNLGYIQQKFVSIAKSSLFKVPIVKQILEISNTIPIERGNLEKAKKSLEFAGKIAKKGINILVFPEGTRRRRKSV